jgi:hypothetical protein
MLLLAILIISILSIINSYELRGSDNKSNSLLKSSSSKDDDNLKKDVLCHPDLPPQNCNIRALYPYPINTKYYWICYQNTITIDKENVYMYVKYSPIELLLFTYIPYFDGVSAKADIQGWCPFN